MLRRLLNWLKGIDPLEEETWRIIGLKETMPRSEWLTLANPHYNLLLARLRQDNDHTQSLLRKMEDTTHG